MVKHVESFRPELQRPLLPDREPSRQTRVDSEKSRTPDTGGPHIAIRACCSLREGRWVEVLIGIAPAGWSVHIRKHLIRSLIGSNPRQGGIDSGGYREVIAGQDPDDARNLPARSQKPRNIIRESRQPIHRRQIEILAPVGLESDTIPTIC